MIPPTRVAKPAWRLNSLSNQARINRQVFFLTKEDGYGKSSKFQRGNGDAKTGKPIIPLHALPKKYGLCIPVTQKDLDSEENGKEMTAQASLS